MKCHLITIALILCSVSCLAQTLPDYVPANGIMAWYPFSGNSGDSSGNGNNGTCFGSTLTSGRFGNPNSAYSFGGSGQYISIPNSPSLNPYNALTLNAWIYHYTVNSREKYIAKLNPADASDFGYGLGYDSGNLHALWETDSCQPATIGGAADTIAFTFDTGFWNMYTMTLSDAGVVNEYIDGILLRTTPTGRIYKGCDTTSSTLQFGYWWSSDPQWFNGKLDDIGLWNRVLSPCEIRHLYDASPSMIIQNPINDTVVIGEAAQFDITDTGGMAAYQWQENPGGGFINLPPTFPYYGVTSKSLTVNPTAAVMTGLQFRCIRTGSPCSDTSSAATLILTPITETGSEQKPAIQLFPNPATNRIYIVSGAPIGTISISDLLGRTVYEVSQPETQATIDVSEWYPGLYLVKNGNRVVKLYITRN